MKSRKSKSPAFPRVVETFMDPTYHVGELERHGSVPDCFNDTVSIRRYRVTAEIIDEPQEVLIERLRKLWRECDNAHHWTPLRAVAAGLGITLDINDVGKDRKKS